MGLPYFYKTVPLRFRVRSHTHIAFERFSKDTQGILTAEKSFEVIYPIQM